MGDAGQSPASAGAGLRGHAFLGNPYDDEGVYGHVPRHPMTHASPLGRAHIAPGQPWARLAAIGPSELQGARGRGS